MIKNKLAAFILIAAVATGGLSHADTHTWTGGGTDDNWYNMPANWGGSAPEANDSLTFAGATRLTPYNNFAANTPFELITFNPDSGLNFSVTGNAITLTSGITNLSGANSFSPGIAMAGERTFDIAASTSLTLGGVLSGTGSLNKTGNGALTLSGNNSYSGGTTVSAGTLVGSTTSIKGHITDNATLIFNQSASGTYAGNISGTGTVIKTGTSQLIFTGTHSYTGGTTVSVGQLRGTTDNLKGSITNNGSVVFDQSTDGTYTGVISGSGSLHKYGSGTVTLTSAQSYTGWTYTYGGTLRLDGNGILPDNTYVFMSSSTTSFLDMRDKSDTIGSLMGGTASSKILLGNGTLTLNYNNAGTYYGGIEGTGAVVQQGSGTFVMAGANIFDGTLTINGGHTIGSTISLPRNIVNNSTLRFEQSFDGTYAGSVSGTGKISKYGAGKVTLTGDTSLTGTVTVYEGTLALGASERLHNSSALTIYGGTFDVGSFSETVGTLTLISGTIAGSTGGIINSSSFTAYSGAVRAKINSVNLTKYGTGTLTITENQALTGTARLSGGKLILNADMSSTDITFLDASTSFGGSGIVNVISGPGTIEPGSSPGILTATQVDPTSGTDWALEFTGTGSPDYDNPTDSINDLLRLTDATAPFTAALTAANNIKVYLNVDSISDNDVFKGGFYTDKRSDFLGMIENASWEYFIKDALGTITYNGVTYSALTAPWSVTLTTIAETANFGAGPVNGYVAKFTLDGPAGDVPEPSTLLLLLPFIGFGLRKYRTRKVENI